MKKIIIFLLVLFNFSFGKPYEPFNQEKMFGRLDGKGNVELNISYILYSVENLFSHARQYPLNFDTEKDKYIAHKDVLKLLSFFEKSSKEIKNLREGFSTQEKFYFDLYEARLFVIAHNFDMQGYAQKADKAYQKLLSKDEKGKIRTEYAEFLGNSTNTDRAMKEFQTAINEGSDRAYFGLAIAYLKKGNREESLKSMQKYIEKFPDDEEAKELLEIFKTAEIKGAGK